MRIILRTINEIDISLEWLAREVVTDIQYNVNDRWHKPSLEQIVEGNFSNYCHRYNNLDNLISYDNYQETIQVITKNMLVWCAENNEQFYDIMIKYDKYAGKKS